MCVTSALKGLAETVYTVLDGIAADDWATYSGKNMSLGIVGDDPSLNYVGLAESTVYNDTFTQDDYLALVKSLAAGEIQVSDDVSAAEPTASNITLNFQGNLK
jgi:basic membrane protein A